MTFDAIESNWDHMLSLIEAGSFVANGDCFHASLVENNFEEVSDIDDTVAQSAYSRLNILEN
jgi:hypothetical protein